MVIYYPRKQTVIIFAICLSLIIVTLYLVNSKNGSTKNNTVSVTTESLQQDKSLPIDEGAFADWRGQFASTTTNKTATNNTKSASEVLTQTDKLGRDVFTRYMDLKQANLLNNTDVVNKSAEDLVTSNINSQPTKTYSASDLRIIKASDAVTLNNFSKNVAGIIETYKITKSESSIMTEYISAEDAQVLKKIDPIIATYKRMISAFLTLPTPEIISKEYLEIINSFGTFEFAAENLRASDTDTVRGLAGVSAHANGAVGMANALTDFHNSMKNYGVIFNFDQNLLNTLLI